MVDSCHILIQVTESRVLQATDFYIVEVKGLTADSCCEQVLPTPLTRLRWWRVCLDEAQMVETTTAKAAMIAVQLRAQHRCAACRVFRFCENWHMRGRALGLSWTFATAAWRVGLSSDMPGKVDIHPALESL